MLIHNFWVSHYKLYVCNLSKKETVLFHFAM